MKSSLWLRILLVYFLITLILCGSLVGSLIGILYQKGILDESLLEEIVTRSIGVFFFGLFVAFVVSMAYNRRFIQAIRNLKEASDKVRKGDLTVTLPLESKDELADVEEAFNLMVRALKAKTDDLKMKELYLNTMMDALWVVDEFNVIVDVNPAFTKLFGYRHEEAVGSSIFDFIDEQDRVTIRSKLQKGQKEQRHITYKTHIIARSGQRVPVLITEAPIVKDRGTNVRIGIIKDISEEERHFLNVLRGIFSVSYERSLFYEKMILERGLAEVILNSIRDGIFTVDLTGKVVSANRAFITITGLSIPDIIGRHYTEVFEPLKGITIIEDLLRGQGPGEEVVETGDGGPVYQIVTSPLLDQLNNLYGGVCVVKDITKDREIDRLKTEIIRSISHEFRTPLSAIIGMTEMVLEGDVSGQKVETYLKTVIREGKRLAGMVSDLLDLSKLESGKIMPRFEEVDLKALIDSVIQRYHLRIKEKGAKVSAEVSEDLKGIFTDQEMLFKVLSNFIDNSLKYSDPGCEINIKVSSRNSYVIITIEDTGWGIPPEDLKHVGERFFRGVHGAKTKGTGLGINLCKQILQQIGGSLEIESVYGKGTTVRVFLKKIDPGGQ